MKTKMIILTVAVAEVMIGLFEKEQQRRHTNQQKDRTPRRKCTVLVADQVKRDIGPAAVHPAAEDAA